MSATAEDALPSEDLTVRFATMRAMLCVAAGYYLTGTLGLLLAIPPGYATE